MHLVWEQIEQGALGQTVPVGITGGLVAGFLTRSECLHVTTSHVEAFRYPHIPLLGGVGVSAAVAVAGGLNRWRRP